MKLDYSKVEVIEVDNIDHKDYPDYCDAYISEAEYDGKTMTSEQLDELNSDDQYLYEAVMEFIY